MTIHEINQCVGVTWFTCPHCKTFQSINNFGINRCSFNECLKDFDVIDDKDTYLKALQEIFRLKKLEKSIPKYIWRQKPARLQKLGNGSTILVPQGGENTLI